MAICNYVAQFMSRHSFPTFTYQWRTAQDLRMHVSWPHFNAVNCTELKASETSSLEAQRFCPYMDGRFLITASKSILIYKPDSVTIRLPHTHKIRLISPRYQLFSEVFKYTTNNKHKRQASMSSGGIEPATPASQRLQICAHGHQDRQIKLEYLKTGI